MPEEDKKKPLRAYTTAGFLLTFVETGYRQGGIDTCFDLHCPAVAKGKGGPKRLRRRGPVSNHPHTHTTIPCPPKPRAPTRDSLLQATV
jgi:hypothetical protein